MYLGVGTYWMLDWGHHHDLVVYGKAMDSSYEEDKELIEQGREDGYIFGFWFSELYPQGELGSNHATRCVEITEEEYTLAEKRIRNGL
jgi:hypothetical protein